MWACRCWRPLSNGNGRRNVGRLERAAAYLAGNDRLFQTLGISQGTLIEPHALGRGEHNENYWFSDPATGKRYVLRVNLVKQPFHDDQVAYEHAALTALEQSGCTPVPLFVDSSEGAPENGVLVESFCAGDELDFDHLRPGDLQCAAQLMADFHAVPVAEDTPLFVPDDPLRTWFDESVARFEFYYSSAYEDARVTRWMQRLIKVSEGLLDAPCPAADRRHIVNSECLASHFLIPAQSAQRAAAALTRSHSGRFTDTPGHFVDWERPIIGEVAQDVAYFVSPTTTVWDSDYFFPGSKIAGFLDDYWRAVDGRFEPGGFEDRFRAFFVTTALHSASWCVRALVYQGEGKAAYSTPKALKKVPFYLSDEFMEQVMESIEAL